MFAASSSTIGGLVIGGLAGGGGAVAIARAVAQTYANRQNEKRDSLSTYERLYGKPANPRTNEPATLGWTDHVDSTLKSLVSTTSETSEIVKAMAEAQGTEYKRARDRDKA